MGQITFEVPPDLPPDRRGGLGRAWFTGGYDGTPIPTRRTDTDTGFSLRRAENESGYLCVPWRDAAGNERVVGSSTLRLSAPPYPVLVELARGAVNRVRAFASVLATAGLDFPAEFRDELARVVRGFGRLALGTETDTAVACELIDAAGAVGDRAAAVLTDYRLQARSQAHGALATRLGCRLSRPLPPEQTGLFAAAFNAVRVVPDWRAIEPIESSFDWSHLDPLVSWATAAGLDVSVGPLIDLADGPFPDWLTAWHGDLPNLAAFLSDFIATVVNRYKDRVRTWHVFAGFNHADVLGMGEDDRLRLAARTLETAQELDPKADRVFSISRPWGDHLTSEDHTYSPLVFADTLMRAGFQPSAVELELLPGVPGRGGVRRDPLDTIHLLELFDTLAVPAEVVVGTPTLESLSTALAAPTVRAVYCDTWSAADPCGRVPAAALIGPDGKPTPAFRDLQTLRERWLR